MARGRDWRQRPATAHHTREKAAAMTLYECEECGAEYTSTLARDACEDNDRENRFER